MAPNHRWVLIPQLEIVDGVVIEGCKGPGSRVFINLILASNSEKFVMDEVLPLDYTYNHGLYDV